MSCNFLCPKCGNWFSRYPPYGEELKEKETEKNVFLGMVCPICGHKYESKWKKEV